MHMYVFKCCAKPKNRACKSLTHKTRAVLYKRSACKVHTHTHAYQFHVKRVLGPGTKLIPSILSWSQQNDLKTTFLIILPHQIKRTLRLSKKKRKKRGLPLTQKGFLKAPTSAQQPIQNNYDGLHELRECHKSRYTLLRLSHRTWLKPNVYIPCVKIWKICIVIGCPQNICRMIMYRLSVREYCVFFKMHV